jgi:hypothetical protein
MRSRDGRNSEMERGTNKGRASWLRRWAAAEDKDSRLGGTHGSGARLWAARSNCGRGGLAATASASNRSVVMARVRAQSDSAVGKVRRRAGLQQWAGLDNLFLLFHLISNFSNIFQMTSNLELQNLTLLDSKNFQKYPGGRQIQKEQLPFLDQLPITYGF